LVIALTGHISYIPSNLVIRISPSCLSPGESKTWQLSCQQASPPRATGYPKEPSFRKLKTWKKMGLGSFAFDLMEQDICWQEIKLRIKDFSS
jgi:hypothetical protein